MTPEPKRCANCNRLFGPRKLKNGKTAYPSEFKKVRFCSRICAGVGVESQKKLGRDAGAEV